METLDFEPAKSQFEFRDNYKLHDLAEATGKSLLVQWGFEFNEFGIDNRFNRIWEKGEDKPDLIITYKLKDALLDWKAKKKPVWIANGRAVQAYERWGNKLALPVFLVFIVFNEQGRVTDRRFACLGRHSYVSSQQKQWDKNSIVEFQDDLPEFTKPNLLKYLFNY